MYSKQREIKTLNLVNGVVQNLGGSAVQRSDIQSVYLEVEGVGNVDLVRLANFLRWRTGEDALNVLRRVTAVPTKELSESDALSGMWTATFVTVDDAGRFLRESQSRIEIGNTLRAYTVTSGGAVQFDIGKIVGIHGMSN